MVLGKLCVKFICGSDRSAGRCPGSADRYWWTANCQKYAIFQHRYFPRNVTAHCNTVRVHINRMLQNERVKMWTETICPVVGCYERGNEHSGSIIWRNFWTICVTKSFLRRSVIKFHFNFLHTCSTQLNFTPLLCLTCWCVIFFFRKLSRILMAGEAGFGATRDVTSLVMVRVTVSLVTAVKKNCSAMVPEAYLRSPWLK
jgi:hypothetical protein